MSKLQENGSYILRSSADVNNLEGDWGKKIEKSLSWSNDEEEALQRNPHDFHSKINGFLYSNLQDRSMVVRIVWFFA